MKVALSVATSTTTALVVHMPVTIALMLNPDIV
jgi:hypothetical protein